MDGIPLRDGLHGAVCVTGGKAITLLASKTQATAATTNEASVRGFEAFRQVGILLALTDAKAAAGDTLDVYIDTTPDGDDVADASARWINVVHFTQILGNGADSLKFLAVLNSSGDPGTSVIASTTDCAAGAVRPAWFGNRLRVRHVVVNGGTGTQSFTFEVIAYAKG